MASAIDLAKILRLANTWNRGNFPHQRQPEEVLDGDEEKDVFQKFDGKSFKQRWRTRWGRHDFWDTISWAADAAGLKRDLTIRSITPRSPPAH